MLTALSQGFVVCAVSSNVYLMENLEDWSISRSYLSEESISDILKLTT